MLAPSSMILVSFPAGITYTVSATAVTTCTTDRGDAEAVRIDLPMAGGQDERADTNDKKNAGNETEGRSRKIRYAGYID